ncbi:hypothetical protein PMAYCL1PPCAC_16704, partial [Pristionchus mayeri]
LDCELVSSQIHLDLVWPEVRDVHIYCELLIRVLDRAECGSEVERVLGRNTIPVRMHRVEVVVEHSIEGAPHVAIERSVANERHDVVCRDL